MSKSSTAGNKKRAVVLVVDGCGIGAAPDAEAFGDSTDCNTLANIAEKMDGLNLPNFARLGLGHVHPIKGVGSVQEPEGYFGKLKESSNGKDTQTGHWELMGLISKTAFPTYPNGFPEDVIERFVKETGCGGILSNVPISGTTVIEQHGQEHQRTGHPIVYTSGDSVFQIACHVDTIPLEKQYEWCRIARKMLDGEHRVGRVICRPFTGKPGSYTRLGGDRRDYAVPPPGPTLLDYLCRSKTGVLGIGKIEDIFNRQGITHAVHTGSNREGLELTMAAIEGRLDLASLAIVENAPADCRMVFTNLVDTDMLFGHRRDVHGYAKALVEVDEGLGKLMAAMGDDDLLLISSDHGNDPTAPGTDHTREFVPVLAYSPALKNVSSSDKTLGILDGFVDVAASLATWFDIPWDGPGVSFIPKLSKVG